MEAFEKIENKIKTMSDHGIVSKKKSPVAAIVLTVIGAVFVVMGSSDIISGDVLEMTIMSLGAMVALYGFAKLLLVSQKDAVDYVYIPTKKKLKAHKVYITSSDRMKVDKFIETNDFSNMKTIRKENSSNHMVRWYGTDDGEIAVCQVLEYIPHTFEPASPVVLLRGNEARNMLEFINQK